ncbi:MAG TPA: TlpA disulfide reductase family protein, partial [Chitinophagales bacterium]|nr:TlpA disulfide reductase family protein [Chitinophagales bacterium]
MRKVIGFLTLLLVFSACKLNGSSDKYNIVGTIKNYNGGKRVTLEKLGLQKITAIDSANIDDKGAFKMEGIGEKGFYRLKFDDRTFFLFILEPAKYTFDIDLQNQADPVKIKGTAENDEFQVAIKNVQMAQQQFNSYNMAYQMMVQQGVSQDTLNYVIQQLQGTAAKLEAMVKDSSRTTKSPLVAMFYVTNFPMDKFPQENLAVIQRMEKEIPNSEYTKDFRAAYDKYLADLKTKDEMKQTAASIGVGKPAPDIDLKNPEGKTIKLSSLKGKVVLLDFWASWCGPCRMEMPNVVAAYKKYKDKGFTVYSVSLDRDADAWKGAIKNLGMVWENHVSDLKWWQFQ